MHTGKMYEIHTDGFYGNMLIPDKDLHPGVVMLVLGGGGVPYQLTVDEARAFADNGITSLALGYFDVPEAPKTISDIPIEYVEKAVHSLKTEEYDKIVAIGISKGAELALVSASLIPDISGVIALSPPAKVYMGLGKRISWQNRSSWTYRGRELPYAYTKPNMLKVFMKSLRHQEPTLRDVYIKASAESDDSSDIRCDDIQGPILLVSADYDSMWPSRQSCVTIKKRLEDNGFPYPCNHLNYQYASHLVLPFRTSYSRLFKMGRKHAYDCDQTADELMKEIVSWISNILMR